MHVMKFIKREKRKEQVVVRALHYITSLRLAWKKFMGVSKCDAF
jgi:hypothetical protein